MGAAARAFATIVVLGLLAACGRATPAEQARRHEAAAARALAEAPRDAIRQAAGHYQQALTAWTRAGDLGGQARTEARLGELAAALGDGDVARAHRERAAALFARLGDVDGELRQRIELIWATDLDGEPLLAALDPLFARARSSGARGATVIAGIYRGHVLRDLDRTPAQLAELRALEPIAADLGDGELIARLDHALGDAAYHRGDAAAALNHFEHGRLHTRDPSRGAWLASRTGSVRMDLLNDHAPGKRLVEDALAELVRLGDVDAIQQNRRVLAWAHMHVGEHAAAIAQLEPGLVVVRASGDRAELALWLDVLGRGYLGDRRLADARRSFAELLAIADEFDDNYLREGGAYGLARVALAEGAWAEARTWAERYLATTAARERSQADEHTRVTSTRATRSGQEILVQALVEAGELVPAFLISEAMRSRYLLGALTGTGGAGTPIATLAEAQAALAPDTTLVEYTIAYDQVYAFVVSTAGLVVRRVAGRDEVSEATSVLYRLLADPNAAPADVTAAAVALAALVVAPIAADLHSPRLAVAAERGLARIPFAALPLPGGEPMHRRFELVMVPSLSVVAALRAAPPRRRATRPIAILADPTFAPDERRDVPGPLVATRGDGELARLHASRTEAERIAALVPGAWVALDADASVATARGREVASARVVHFATHALLEARRPEQSGLALARFAGGAPIADGLLGADDIAGLDLAAELVVLSACRSAIGVLHYGEGMDGLTRSFLRTGVPQVVSALWQVDDASTAELMTRFYRGLWRERLDPEAALRAAQLELAADPRFAAPYHWAAFVVVGRPTPRPARGQSTVGASTRSIAPSTPTRSPPIP